MGVTGPVPKREAARVRKNSPKPFTTEAGRGAPNPYTPPVDEDGNPVWERETLLFFESFEKSGQSRFYEATDWAQLYILCVALDREIKPQFVGMQNLVDGSTRPMIKRMPIKGATLNALRSWNSALLAAEGDRRRIQLELEKANIPSDGAGSNVSEARQKVTDIRSRMGQAKAE